MLASTPRRDCHNSPSCRPMLTPSKRHNLARDSDFDGSSADDFFLESPFRSPPHVQALWTRQNMMMDLEDDSISSTSVAVPISQPFLITPARPELQTPSRPGKHTPLPPTPSAPRSNSHAGGGMKRKSTPNSTPLRQHNLTPLKITSSNGGIRAGGIAFDRLAPPDFAARTPPSKGKVDMRKQTASLTKLRITDLNDSDHDFVRNEDSGCEMDDDDGPVQLFLGYRKAPPPSPSKRYSEVAEAISPGGHVTKRRAKARPISNELLESSFKVPSAPEKVSF